MAFTLSLFVSHPFLFGCIGKAVLRDCGISSVSLLIFVCLTLLVCGQALALHADVVCTCFSSSLFVRL